MLPSLETTPKTITVAGNFAFITLGTLNRPDLHFVGAGNGPVVISWIGREHELDGGASPISLLNIVSLSDMIEGSYHSWNLYTIGQLVDGLQQKRKPVFIKRKWNHVVFSRVTILSFHPVEGSYRSWDLYTTGQLVDGLQKKKKKTTKTPKNKQKMVFIKRKWNNVVFSRATILSFHPLK